LENKNAIILLFIANSISGMAQGLTMIAIPWYIINTLKVPTLFGIIYFMITFFSLFWGTYAGGLIDKFNRKHLFIYQNLAGCFILSLAALLGFYLNNVSLAMASVVFMFSIFVYNIHYPNLYAFVQEISETKNYGKVNSYIEIQGQLTTVLSGALATILINGDTHFFSVEIKQWSLQQVFALDACTYLSAASIIFFIRYRPLVKRYKEGGTILKQLATGFNYLKQHKSIFLFGTASYGIFVCILVAVHYILPNYINQILNEPVNVYAKVEVLFAFGAIFAGITITKIFVKTNAVIAVIIMTVLVGLLFFAVNLYPQLWFFYCAFFIIGLCNAGTRIMRITYIFKKIPNQMIGRSSAVFRIGSALTRLFFIALFTLPLFTANLKLPFYVYFIFLMIIAVLLYKAYLNLYKKPIKLVG